MNPETAKAATVATVCDLQNNSELLGKRLTYTKSVLAHQAPPPSSQNYFDDQDRALAVIPKGRRKAVVVTTSTRGGRRLADIRVHEPDGKRALQATRSGIANIDPAVARAIAAALIEFAEGST